ncbi:unnamed protein product [Prorocentrum cordatum]|uniref:Uncharacterized protein n=2 Tax=Prorocentrum cordatum TaxID=2364126 RepID=A0ABN9UUV5_9DINO|nr:unnamed protein product [Polarella glacialis]
MATAHAAGAVASTYRLLHMMVMWLILVLEGLHRVLLRCPCHPIFSKSLNGGPRTTPLLLASLEYTDVELDRMAAAEQTSLAKTVEQATKAERLAHQEVQWRLDRFNKAKKHMEEAQSLHLEAVQELEQARATTREANERKASFDVQTFKKEKRHEVEQRRRQRAAEEARAAADARAAASVPPAAGLLGAAPATAPAGVAAASRAPGTGDAAAAGAGAQASGGVEAQPMQEPQPMDEDDADVPWLRGKVVDYMFVEANLHTFSDDDLEKLVASSAIGLEQWQQYRLHLQRMRGVGDEDNLSDLGSEVADNDMEPQDRDRYRDLKRRAVEQGLDVQAAQEYTDLLSKRIMAKAGKRARVVSSVTADMYRNFCDATAKQMGVPRAAAAVPPGHLPDAAPAAKGAGRAAASDARSQQPL